MQIVPKIGIWLHSDDIKAALAVANRYPEKEIKLVVGNQSRFRLKVFF